MDINENLTQVNIFVGGMNTDTSDAMMDDKLYRFAKNLRITTNTDENSGELHLIEGTVPVNWDPEKIEYMGEIIASTSIREYGILITKDTDKWSIYKFKENETPERIFGPCTEPLPNKPSLLTRYESYDNIKLYIADGEHQLMSINIYEGYQGSNIEDLQGHVNTALDPLDVEISDVGGTLKPAKVQYCYRLYSENGSATRISPLSKPISLYKDEVSGYSNKEKSGRSVNIKVPTAEYTNLNKILIFRITYVENGQVPEVSMIKDQKYVPDRTILDNGSSDIQSIAMSELLSYVNLGVIPKIIESKNDYLFAAGIKYKQDDVNEKFKNIDTTSLSSGNYIEDGILKHRAFDYTKEIRWNSEHWSRKDGILGGEGEWFDWRYVTETAQIKQGNQGESYKTQTSCLRAEEVYRFGVILYDMEGNASSVKWIADILMPSFDSGFYDVGTVTKGMNFDRFDLDYYSVKNVTIEFTLKGEIPQCSKYEIVRCNRTLSDKFTITQGLTGQPLNTYARESTSDDWDTSKLCPSGFMTFDNIRITEFEDTAYLNELLLWSLPQRDILQFASPEYCYQEDDIQNLINQNINDIHVVPVRKFLFPCKIEDGDNIHIIGTGTNQLIFETDCLFGSRGRDNNFDNAIKVERGNKYSQVYYTHLQPLSQANVDKERDIENITVKSVSYVKSQEYDSFCKGEEIRFKDDNTPIGPYQYINWTIPAGAVLDTKKDGAIDTFYKNKASDVREMLDFNGPWGALTFNPEMRLLWYPASIGGKCILFELEEKYQPNIGNTIVNGNGMMYSTGFMDTIISDIRKSAVPYGGYDKEAIENSVYYSFGNVFPNNPGAVKFEGGDAYYRMFDYVSAHYWFDATYCGGRKMCNVYSIPILSDIDLHGQFGYKFNPTSNLAYCVQDKACQFDNYIQDRDLYLYNTAYNAYPDAIGFTSEEQDKNNKGHYDTRIHYSEQKTNGESIDSWLLFKAMNFLDVDSRHGEITGLRLFKDKLIFWLKDATGLLSVNERVLLKDSEDTQIVLGTGSVLERYDYFTTLYGMKPDIYVDTQSDSSLYWWDGYRKEILQYTEGYAVTPLTTVKLVKNYINERDEAFIPTIFYDPANKEVVCSCVLNDSLVYSEQIQQFSSVYEFIPTSALILNNKIYTFSKTKGYVYNMSDGNGSMLFNEKIFPYIKFIVNKNSQINKTFDIQTIGGRLYGGDNLESLQMTFSTPLKQEGRIISGKGITNREYDFRLNVPRAGIQSTSGWLVSDFGDRLRGKTMQCELWSTNNSNDFSLQYITTKFRISWS